MLPRFLHMRQFIFLGFQGMSGTSVTQEIRCKWRWSASVTKEIGWIERVKIDNLHFQPICCVTNVLATARKPRKMKCQISRNQGRKSDQQEIVQKGIFLSYDGLKHWSRHLGFDNSSYLVECQKHLSSGKNHYDRAPCLFLNHLSVFVTAQNSKNWCRGRIKKPNVGQKTFLFF